MTFVRAALAVILAFAAAGCGIQNLLGSSPATNSTTVRSYLGTWVGPPAASFTASQTCGTLQWKITSQTDAQFAGDFQAACAGGTTLAGTLQATHSPTAIPWAASGIAAQGSTSCPFTVAGTGTFQGTSNILLTYTGTSCLGPVVGTDTITR